MEGRFLNYYPNSKGEYFKVGDKVQVGNNKTIFEIVIIDQRGTATTQLTLMSSDVLGLVVTTIGRVSLHPSQFLNERRFPTIESLPDKFYVVQRSTPENIILFNQDFRYSNGYYKHQLRISAHSRGFYAFVGFSKNRHTIKASLFVENGYSKDELSDHALNFIKDKTLLSAEEFYELFKLS